MPFIIIDTGYLLIRAFFFFFVDFTLLEADTQSHWNLGLAITWFKVIMVSAKFKLTHRMPITKCEKKVSSVKNSRSTVPMRRFIISLPYTTSVVFTVCVHTQTPSMQSE